MATGLTDRQIREGLQSKTNGTTSRKESVCPMVDRTMLVEAASSWIETQNVTHYFTLTYPRRFSWEARHKAFSEWVDALEWRQRRPLGWIRADEMFRFSGLGFPEIPEHHHGLLFDTDHLCCRTAENIWRHFGDGLVERYERNGGAIPYCLKHAFSHSGEWDIGGKALRNAHKCLDTIPLRTVRKY
jgi:hypothetical protein